MNHRRSTPGTRRGPPRIRRAIWPTRSTARRNKPGSSRGILPWFLAGSKLQSLRSLLADLGCQDPAGHPGPGATARQGSRPHRPPDNPSGPRIKCPERPPRLAGAVAVPNPAITRSRCSGQPANPTHSITIGCRARNSGLPRPARYICRCSPRPPPLTPSQTAHRPRPENGCYARQNPPAQPWSHVYGVGD